VRSYVKANPARFKVPGDVEFVTALPRTATGRVRKSQLTRPAPVVRIRSQHTFSEHRYAYPS
jgi:non-ribosomal peptide synthetase component E (peptide arylation enzyme)